MACPIFGLFGMFRIADGNHENKYQWNQNLNTTILYKEINLKMSSVKWRSFCLCLTVLKALAPSSQWNLKDSRGFTGQIGFPVERKQERETANLIFITKQTHKQMGLKWSISHTIYNDPNICCSYVLYNARSAHNLHMPHQLHCCDTCIFVTWLE